MNFDVIVIGGGIIGCTHAFFLQQLGLRTLILEKGDIGAGTTAHNFSWINATTKVKNAPYHNLNALGVRMYHDLADEIGEHMLGINRTGSLGLVSGCTPDLLASLKNHANDLKELGYPVDWVSGADLRDLEPNIQFADDAQALWAPKDAILNATAFTQLMAQKTTALGGEVRTNCAAFELMLQNDGTICGVSTAQGDFLAPKLVLCAGPDTPAVLGKLTGYEGFATRFPVNRVPGLLVTTPPVRENLIRHLCFTDVGGEFHFLPDFDGGLRLASDDADGAIIADQSDDHLRHLAQGLLQRMHDFVPEFGADALIDDCFLAVGTRAYPADGYSIAGALPGADGLFIIATHSGVTLAPALGSSMAMLVATDESPDILAPFALERLPGFN